MNRLTKENRRRVLRAFTVFTAVATMFSLSGFAMLAPAYAAVPSDYGLTEGDTISAAGSDDPDIYIVNEHGYKRLFLNPAIFNFYGHLGGFAAVTNVSSTVRDAFPTSGLFRNCETGDERVYGLESTGEDVGMLHWVNTTGAQAVADDPNFFQKVFCINSNEFNWYAKGADYTSVSQVPDYSREPGDPAPGAGLSASLASSNPASMTLIAEQGLADLAHFNVSGSGSVTSVELDRLGISGDSTLANVFLFVNGQRVSDAGSVSEGKITYNDPNGLFTAPAVLSVRSDIAADTSGQTAGVGVSMLNSTSVSVNGNIHTIAAKPTDLETVAVGTATSAGGITAQPDVLMWQSNLTVGQKAVSLKRLSLRQVGSVNANDIGNFVLFVDGVQVATVANLDSNGYLQFVGLDHNMNTGTRVVKVQADIIGGASRTYRFSLEGAYDLESVGSNYGASIKPTGTFAARPDAGIITEGTVTTIKRTDSPAANVVKETTDAVVARFDMTAYGEDIKLDTLSVTATTSDTAVESLRNSRLLINGTQYGSTGTITTSPTTAKEFTTNYTLQPGVTVTVEVRADMFDNDGTNDLGADDTVTFTLATDTDNGRKQTSATLLDVPSADVAGNTITVVAGSMTVSKYQAFANQTVTVPASNMLLGRWTLTGNSSEDITVNTIKLGINKGDQWTAEKLTDVRVEVDGVLFGSAKATVTNTASQSYSGSLTLAKNQNRDVRVYANVSSFTVADDNDTMAIEMNVTGITDLSGTTVYAPSETGQTIGQTMTAGTGTFTTAVGASTPVDKIAAGNTTTDALQVRFTAQNDTFTIKTLKFKVDNANAASTIANVRLLDNSDSFVDAKPMVLLASGSYYATFDGLSIPVPANEEINVTAQLELGGIGIGAATSSADAKLTMTSVVRANSSGVEATSDTDRAGNNLYVHKSYPMVAQVALPSTLLTVGSSAPSSKFTISAVQDTVAVKRIVWDITRSGVGVKFASTTSSGKLVINGQDVTTDLGGSIPWVYTGHIGTTGTVSYTFTNEYQVAVGSPITVEFRPDLTTVPADSSLITTLDVGESSVVLAGDAYAAAAAGSSKLVWSDRSGDGSSGTLHSELTADWFNDHLVKDSVSQALSN